MQAILAREFAGAALSHPGGSSRSLRAGNAPADRGGPEMKEAFRITVSEAKTQMLGLYGRKSWTLAELIKAGEKGCTQITHPEPYWSTNVLPSAAEAVSRDRVAT